MIGDSKERKLAYQNEAGGGLVAFLWQQDWPPDEAWPGLLRLADGNDVLPLVVFLAQGNEDKLPENARSLLREARYRVLALHSAAEVQIRHLGQAAVALGIRLILLKGPVVARTYPHPAARSFRDLDVLAPSEETAHLLKSSLESQGYTSEKVSRAWHLPPLYPPGSGLRVEIHHRLGDGSLGVPVDGIWKRAEPSAYFQGLWEMAAVDHALYLIFNAVEKDSLRSGPRWLYDLSCWTREWDESEWAVLAERARAWEMERALSLAGVLWAWVRGETWDALPFATSLSLPPVEIENLARRIVMGAASARLPGVWRDRAKSSLGGWLRYGFEVLACGGDLSLAQIPRRLVYLMRQHGPSLWQLLRGDPRARATWQRQRDLYEWLRENK